MNFTEALNKVITEDVIVWRKAHQFEDDYDRPASRGEPTPWSEWIRIRMEDDDVDFDALVFIESNNRDDITGTWFLDWRDDALSRADIQANDWEVV